MPASKNSLQQHRRSGTARFWANKCFDWCIVSLYWFLSLFKRLWPCPYKRKSRKEKFQVLQLDWQFCSRVNGATTKTFATWSCNTGDVWNQHQLALILIFVYIITLRYMYVYIQLIYIHKSYIYIYIDILNNLKYEIEIDSLSNYSKNTRNAAVSSSNLPRNRGPLVLFQSSHHLSYRGTKRCLKRRGRQNLQTLSTGTYHEFYHTIFGT